MYSDSKGNVVGISDSKVKGRINLINPKDKIKIKKSLADKCLFQYFYFKNKKTGDEIMVPMNLIIEDGILEHGDYIYKLK